MAFFDKAKGNEKQTFTSSSDTKVSENRVSNSIIDSDFPTYEALKKGSSTSTPDSSISSTLNKSSTSKSDSETDLSMLDQVKVDLKEAKVETELEMGSRINLLDDFVEGQNVEIDIDLVVKVLLENKGRVHLSKIIQDSNLSKKEVNNYISILEKGGLIEIIYPSNPFSSAIVKIRSEAKKSFGFVGEFESKESKLLEKYTVISDYVVADVKIWSVPFENTPIYEVLPHKLGLGSFALILYLIPEMARIIPVKLEEITDPRKMLELKNKFYDVAKKLIKQQVPSVNDRLLKVLTGVLLHRSYGLGDMEVIMSDNWLEEVAINNASYPITVYHRKYGWLKTTKKFESEQEIYNFSSHIGRKVGKQISNLEPIMDAHMLTGDRVAATLFPISTEGDTLTIRRFSRNPWTITHMLDPNNSTMSLEMAAFIWMCVQYELNILVVGGTASGKTSALNTFAALIPPTNRVISIEDTREIFLPEALHWNWVPMASRPKNTEGVGEITMLDLMIASLRMRPDRIIVGEIRRKQQAEALFEAMHTGHSVCATMHADTSEQIKRRLTQPPIEIPEDEIQALQLVVVQYRDRRKGVRRTLEIAELLPGSNDSKVNLNYLYRWRPRKDVFEKENKSIRIFEDLNLHTGMTVSDIEKDIEEKKLILQWLVDNDIKDINKVGQIMRIYYKYPKLLLDTIHEGGDFSGIAEMSK